MHPSKFVDEVTFKISEWDFGHACNDEIKNKLRGVHPLNFIRAEVVVPIYEVIVSYSTTKGNRKESTKYMILDPHGDIGDDSLDYYAEIKAESEIQSYAGDHSIINPKVESVEFLCYAVLPIG